MQLFADGEKFVIVGLQYESWVYEPSRRRVRQRAFHMLCAGGRDNADA
jgi:hypothetical protein